MPAETTSSTAYYIKGLSIIGNNSFGMAFVTGKPRSIAGNGKNSFSN
jgi:hypothetical protein